VALGDIFPKRQLKSLPQYLERGARLGGLGIGTAAGIIGSSLAGRTSRLPQVFPSTLAESAKGFWNQARQGDWDAAIGAYQDPIKAPPGYWGASELAGEALAPLGLAGLGGKLLSKSSPIAQALGKGLQLPLRAEEAMGQGIAYPFQKLTQAIKGKPAADVFPVSPTYSAKQAGMKTGGLFTGGVSGLSPADVKALGGRDRASNLADEYDRIRNEIWQEGFLRWKETGRGSLGNTQETKVTWNRLREFDPTLTEQEFERINRGVPLEREAGEIDAEELSRLEEATDLLEQLGKAEAKMKNQWDDIRDDFRQDFSDEYDALEGGHVILSPEQRRANKITDEFNRIRDELREENMGKGIRRSEHDAELWDRLRDIDPTLTEMEFERLQMELPVDIPSETISIQVDPEDISPRTEFADSIDRLSLDEIDGRIAKIESYVPEPNSPFADMLDELRAHREWRLERRQPVTPEQQALMDALGVDSLEDIMGFPKEGTDVLGSDYGVKNRFSFWTDEEGVTHRVGPDEEGLALSRSDFLDRIRKKKNGNGNGHGKSVKDTQDFLDAAYEEGSWIPGEGWIFEGGEMN
jgi:hypothetical protein